MNSQLKDWVGNSCTPEKAEVLETAMDLLVCTIGTELESVWMSWYYRVGIDDDITSFQNLQQSILDGTIQSIEQFGITIEEDVGFAEQQTLTMLLTSLYGLDSSELVDEMRGVLGQPLDSKDQLVALLAIVSEGAFEELIEDVSGTLLASLKNVYLTNAWMEESEPATTKSETIANYIKDLQIEHDIVDYYLNGNKLGYPFEQYLALYSGTLSALTDPGELSGLTLLLYLYSQSDMESAQDAVSNAIAILAGDGKLEFDACRSLITKLRLVK